MSNNYHHIEIIEFSDELSEPVKALNYEWIEKYFHVEEGDILSLTHPKKYIIEKGGHIFYAKWNDEIVGTASLLKKSEAIYDFGKMAVSSKAQGHGVGTKSLEHRLEVARQKKIATLIGYSTTILQ